MGIELPDAPAVDGAIAIWRGNDPRLGALFERYGAAPQALRHYGLILWDEGQSQTAAQVLTGAVALKPEDAVLWMDLAGALSASGLLTQAAACIEESLVRDGTQATSWLRLGSIRSALQETDGAEQALRTALALDPDLTDARLSLGLVYFHRKRFAEAAACLGTVIQTTDVSSAVQACYGQALSHSGDFAGAARALRIASEGEPENVVVARKWAQMVVMTDLMAGASVADVMTACRSRPLVGDDEAKTIARHAFHLLSAFGHTQAALRLGEARLADNPEDAEQAYLLAVLRGEALRQAPDGYVTSFFDGFASEFDKQLVDVLGYTAFEKLAALVATYAKGAARVLDLGCGTGLAGPLLAASGRHLTGVDLSAGMLDKARARACYDVLATVEASAFLADKVEAFDLIFAADVLIYIGELQDLVPLVARALTPGGLFAFTIETSADAALALLPSGRFAHGLEAVLALGAAAGFETLATETIDLRYETHGFVEGALIVMRR